MAVSDEFRPVAVGSVQPHGTEVRINSHPFKEREIDLRVELLKEVLKSDKPDYDLLHREMARVIIAMYGELATLEVVRADFARLSSRLILFMDDQIAARITRQTREAESAKTEYEKSLASISESQKMKKILKSEPTLPLSVQTNATPSLRSWFIERVAPGLTQWIIILALGGLGAAVWLAIKVAVNKP